jgi:hypothetical protein
MVESIWAERNCLRPIYYKGKLQSWAKFEAEVRKASQAQIWSPRIVEVKIKGQQQPIPLLKGMSSN